MKKLTLIMTVAALISCSKNENDQPSPPQTVTESNGLPSTFVQRVLLETFTSAVCSTCPESDYKRDQVISNYPGKVIGITIHNNDSMAITAYTWYYLTFGCGIPSGMISRIPSLGNVVLNANQWMSNATTALSRIAKCGLNVSSSLSGNNATIEVKAGFIENYTEPLTLNICLVEDSLSGNGTGWSQANGYNTVSGSPFYNQGNPIPNYSHKRVVRKLLTTVGGDAIPSSYTIKNGIYTKTISTSIAGLNANNTYVVAFINKAGSSPVTHEVLNVNTARLGQSTGWN